MVRVLGPRDIQTTTSRPVQESRYQADDVALEELSKTFTSVANRLAENRQEAEDAGFRANVYSAADSAYLDTYENYKSTALTDDPNFVANLDKNLNDVSNDVIESSKKEGGFRPSDRTINQVKIELARLRGNYLTNATAYENNVRVAKLTENLDASIQSFAIDSYNNPLALAENNARINELITSHRSLIPQAELSERRKEALKNNVDSAITGLISQDPEDARDRLKKNEFDKYLSADEKARYLALSDSSIEANALEQKRLSEEAHQAAFEKISRDVSNLEVAVNTSQGSIPEQVEAIEGLFDRKFISLEKRTELLTKIVKRQLDSVDDTNNLAMVMARLDGDDSVIVDNKSIDKIYKKHFAPQMETNAHKAVFVDRMKYVPEQIKNEVINGLYSNNDELILDSADMIDRIDNLRGIPEQTFNQRDLAYADQVVFLMNYLPKEEAIKQARINTDPTDKARIEAREKVIKDDKWSEEYEGIVKDEFDFKFFGTTVDDINKSKLSRDFGQLAESFYKAGMERDSAFERASREMKRIWGRTDVTTSPRAMKYPPEMYYGFKDEVAKDLKDSVETYLDGTKYDEYFLLADDTTAREASIGRPSYVVVIKDENGLTPLINFRWAPDLTEHVQKTLEKNKETVEHRRALGKLFEGLGEKRKGTIDELREEQRYLRDR